MGFLNILSKKRVPSELPTLLVNDNQFSVQPKSMVQQPSSQKTQSYQPLPITPLIKVQPPSQNKNLIAIPIQPQSLAPQGENSPAVYEKSRAFVEEERGYFKDLLKNVTLQSKNIEKLEDWYENKFVTEDIVHQMKNYWEDQKPQLMINSLGKDLKEKMLQKTDLLHNLEKEWQENYTNLLTKEEEIRAQEKELKLILAEFLTMYKKHMPKGAKGQISRLKDK